MTRMIRTSLLLIGLLAVAACDRKPPDSAYYTHGGPESLLDVSSEVVNLSVADNQSLQALTDWIHQDQPTRAELYCTAGDPRCNEARKVLDLNGVPTMLVPSGDYNVALVYERILARDCKQRYVDNSHNDWNTNHPAFGCSVAANVVQQVSDKQEFVAPNLSDVPRADQAVAAYGRAMAPPAQPKQAYSVEQSLTSQAQSGGQ